MFVLFCFALLTLHSYSFFQFLIITVFLVLSLAGFFGRRYCVRELCRLKKEEKEGSESVKLNASICSLQQFVFGLIGGVSGIFFVRVLFLSEVEKMGFSLVMNNLGSLSFGDIQNIICNSSTFWKCFFGFVAGSFAGRFAHKIYLKKNPDQSNPSDGIANFVSKITSAPSSKPSVESRLTELKTLKEKGFITDEEYEKRKTEIVKEL
ncbi:MAG TPA: SHOCT domain-containing protein [Verrucomicrobiae bacterium]